MHEYDVAMELQSRNEKDFALRVGEYSPAPNLSST
jgi:hypothetical protein